MNIGSPILDYKNMLISKDLILISNDFQVSVPFLLIIILFILFNDIKSIEDKKATFIGKI